MTGRSVLKNQCLWISVVFPVLGTAFLAIAIRAWSIEHNLIGDRAAAGFALLASMKRKV
jgi:hypothetical protein